MANYLTQEGYNKKMEELAALEAQRPMIKQAIAEARDKGDLSENAEYDAAKEAQGMLEMKIAKLKELVASARIIDDSNLNTEEVQLLNKVTIKNVANGMQMTYTIVTDSEANLKEMKISQSTPIAKALIGHKVGDKVQVRVPAGLVDFEIIKIEIIAGEIPCYKVAENDKFFAFLDINPVNWGHTLVVPKRETDYIFDISDEELAEMIVFAKKVAKALKAVMPCRKIGVTVLGLEVPHAHIHLVPLQKEGDMDFSNKISDPDPERMADIAAKVAAEFGK